MSKAEEFLKQCKQDTAFKEAVGCADQQCIIDFAQAYADQEVKKKLNDLVELWTKQRDEAPDEFPYKGVYDLFIKDVEKKLKQSQ